MWCMYEFSSVVRSLGSLAHTTLGWGEAGGRRLDEFAAIDFAFDTIEEIFLKPFQVRTFYVGPSVLAATLFATYVVVLLHMVLGVD